MKGITIAIAATLALTGLACQSAEQRQANELRETLFGILDKVEELNKQEITARETVVEIYEELGQEARSRVKLYKDYYEKYKKERPEALKDWRKRVEEYTDLELPALAQIVRQLPREAERFITLAQRDAQQAREYVERAPKRAARKKASSTLSKPSAAKSRVVSAAVKKPKPRPPAPPPPDPEELRKTYSARIDKLDKMHEELIDVLEAVQAAQTDREKKRQARGAVTMARFARRKDVPLLRRQLEGTKKGSPLWPLDSVGRSVELQQYRIQNEIDQAKKKLQQVQGD